MLVKLLAVLLMGCASDGIQTKFVSSGASVKAGGYRPLRAEMDKSEELFQVRPQDLTAPKYGEFAIDGGKWGFILDEPAEGDARLFVDANGDGDLTNDPEVKWEKNTNNNQTMYQGSVEVDLGNGRKGALGLYRFDPADPQRAALKNTVLYYADYGTEITFNLDGQEFSCFVTGLPNERSAFWIDRDNNGRRSAKRETAHVGKPFNFTGTTYWIDCTDGQLTMSVAADPVPMTPLPPDTSIGQPAIPFSAKTTAGSDVHFPESYHGKIVMLDFWATWCGPCIAEIPHMKEAYEKWHDQGFEILGISFDRPEMEEKLAEFTSEREMPWPQIYEGKFWDTTLGEMYDVSGIPFVLLVDGSTGEILATSRELRGRGLSDFIGTVIEARKNRDK